MYIESFQVSYPYELTIPGKRFGSHPLDFYLDKKPDYSVMIVEVEWVDEQGSHFTPLSAELIDRAERDGQTDEQTIKHLRHYVHAITSSYHTGPSG